MPAPADLSDEAWQIAVLSRVLILHPERLSPEELQREMRADASSGDFIQSDAHDRAVCELIAAGLLRRDGDSIGPTRAALYFYALHG